MTDRLRQREHAPEDLAEVFADLRRFIFMRAAVARGIMLSFGYDSGFRRFALFIWRRVLGSLGQRIDVGLVSASTAD